MITTEVSDASWPRAGGVHLDAAMRTLFCVRCKTAVKYLDRVPGFEVLLATYCVPCGEEEDERVAEILSRLPDASACAKEKRMSRRLKDGTFLIESEPPKTCELCGRGDEETRPYGPNGEEVCYECGMKDEEAAARAFRVRLLGLH